VVVGANRLVYAVLTDVLLVPVPREIEKKIIAVTFDNNNRTPTCKAPRQGASHYKVELCMGMGIPVGMGFP